MAIAPLGLHICGLGSRVLPRWLWPKGHASVSVLMCTHSWVVLQSVFVKCHQRVSVTSEKAWRLGSLTELVPGETYHSEIARPEDLGSDTGSARAL